MANKLPSEPISGQLYPELKGKPGSRTFQNPPFHPNILNIGGANKTINPKNWDPYNPAKSSSPGSPYRPDRTTSFNRGILISGPDVIDGLTNSDTYIVNFLYNPSTIQESRGLDVDNNVLPSWKRNPDDPGSYNVPLNTGVNFSLLFDRTYELWDSSYRNTLAGVFGVRADVEAFYNLMGINSFVSQSKSAIAGKTDLPGLPSGVADVVVQGPMQMVPTYLSFGYNSSGSLEYFGYISAFDVTYTHFTQKMVPVRCAVNVSFTVTPPVQSTDKAKNSG